MLRLKNSILFPLLLSCQTTGSEFQNAVKNRQCEDAAQNLLQDENLLKMGSRAKQIGGVTASTVAMSAAFIGDFVVVVGVGGTIGIVACSPLVALDVLLKASGPAISSQCLGTVASTAYPGLTKATSNSMQGMRKYDLTALTQGLRLVAECFYDRNGEGDREKAKKQLLEILENKELIAATRPNEVENLSRLQDLYFPEKAQESAVAVAKASLAETEFAAPKLKAIHFSKTALTFDQATTFCELKDMRPITRREAQANSAEITVDDSKEYVWAVDSFAQSFQTAWRIETRNGLSSIVVDIELQAFAACVAR